MDRILNIEIPYAGLGDHLFHSHLPRIAKETGLFDRVYISSNSLFRNNDDIDLVWGMNPYVDGFSSSSGKTCSLPDLAKKVLNYISKADKNVNLLDVIMLDFGLDDGKRMHEPEVYYQPKYVDLYNKVIFDPNYISYTGDINKADVSAFFKKQGIYFDAVMKIRSDKALHVFHSDTLYLETPTLTDFCDLIFSCKEMHCFTTGTATLAAALGKPAHVYYGNSHHEAMRHSAIHEYIKIKPCNQTKLSNLLKAPYRFIKYRLVSLLSD